MNKELTKNCVQCGTEFNYVPNKLNEQKYCSKVCRNKSNNIRRIQLIRDEYINVTPIINEKRTPIHFPQRERVQNIDNTENNKDYYTLYLEEKHARDIDRLEREYLYKETCQRLAEIRQKMEEKENRDNEIEEEPKNENILNNFISGIAEIGKAYLQNSDNNGKIVKM
jgi:hypothetical protein